jgi:hypothetical protein
MSNLVPARRSSALSRFGADRATGHALAAIQTGAFLERTEDEARRNLGLGRMTDIKMGTRHAMGEADEIVSDFAARAEANPLGAGAFNGIAEDGVWGLRRELRRLSEGW